MTEQLKIYIKNIKLYLQSVPRFKSSINMAVQ